MTTPDPDRLTILGPSGADDEALVGTAPERALRHYLGRLKSRQTGSDPKFNSYAYAEVPEWALRQILDAVEAISSSEARLRELLGKAREWLDGHARLEMRQMGDTLLDDIDAALGVQP